LRSLLTFDFCKFFFEDKIIALEGISDLFAYTFDENKKTIEELIGKHEIINFYGLNNFSRAYTLLSLFKEKEEFMFICDNDGKNGNKLGANITAIRKFNKQEKNVIAYNIDDDNKIDLEKILEIPESKFKTDKANNILDNKEIVIKNFHKILPYINQ
jgi:hypothetical protein